MLAHLTVSLLEPLGLLKLYTIEELIIFKFKKRVEGGYYCFNIQKVKSRRVNSKLLQETPGNCKCVYNYFCT